MSKTLLLADDSVTIQKVVGISLASEDLTLVTVDNGDDAIRRAAEIRPDVVLADVVMPGKNGYEVCAALKADPDLQHIPVLLLTGTFEAFDESRAQSVGAAGHIAKPFEAQALVSEVYRLLAEAAAPAPAAQAPVETTPPDESLTAINPNDDSFDFFDDDLGVVSAASVEPPASPDGLDFDTGDSAFAFGEGDIGEGTEDPISSPGVTPAVTRPTAADSPVAEPLAATDIDPGESMAEVAVVEGPDLVAPESLLDPSDAPVIAIPISGNAGAVDAAFDFSFSGEAEALAEGDDPVGLPIDEVDVARSTVLDPAGASGFDVSSSDLDSSFGEPLGDELYASDATVLAPEFAAEPDARDQESDMKSDMKSDSAFEAAPVASEIEPMSFESADPGPEPQATPGETVLAAEFSGDPVAIPVRDAAATTLLAPEFQTPPEPEPEPEPMVAPEPMVDAVMETETAVSTGERRPLPPETEARAASIVEQIQPQLREQLHDTLEKIAWESFGDLTEQIVRESVAQVEKIAWEVVPRLAEALILEEIRRMKGDPPADD
jgi:CheY-like chemotaxis protein